MTRREWLLTEQPASRRQARYGQAYRTWLALKSNRLAMIGLIIVGALILIAALAPLIAPYSPVTGGDLRLDRLQPPSWAHPFGTDDQARDIFSRVIWGTQLTLMVVLLVAVIATPIGLAVGTTSGYFGGWVDVVLMRITDIFLAFPRLILALAFASALGPGIENAIIAIAITSWPPYARLARAETLTIREADHIAAIRLQGASSGRILLGHVTPLYPSSCA
jgi:peptide/nickel transport system permease protein